MTAALESDRRRIPSLDREVAAPLVGLLIVLLVAVLFAPDFYRGSNLSTIGRQIAILAIIAIGQTIVLIAGGIDLSVGAMMAFGMVVVARLSGGEDGQLLLAILVAVGAGVAVGLLNAFLVVRRRVPPFVATLATLILVRGVQTAWTRGVPSGSLPSALISTARAQIYGVPAPLIVALAFALAAGFLMSFTTYGKWAYTAGMNPSAAHVAGIPTGFAMTMAFIICSVSAVIGGLLLAGYVGYVDQYIGQGYDLDSIAAAVVGGAALTGGRGGVGRSLVGAATIACVLNLVVLSGADQWLQLVVKGAIIVSAVAVQQRARGGR